MIEIKPLHHCCDALIRLPGSKSYTHRALILSALADGESLLINALRSEDTEYTIRGLQQMGIPVSWEGTSLRVLGQGGELRGTEETIFVGNSGTSMRFLTALAALKRGRTLLDGSERMRRRPIEELLNGLKSLGIRACSKGGNGFPPVVVESKGLKGGRVRINCEQSSQFLSAILMVAPYAQEDLEMEVTGLSSRPYVDITRDAMSAFGVEIESDQYRSFSVRSGQHYLGREYRIEGDASHASYFFSAAAITRGRVRVENFNPGSVQGDTGFLRILERMGCEVTRGDGWAEVKGRELRGIEVDMNGMPDLVPTMAVTAAFAQGRTVIKEIGHLRFKESDRIRTLKTELTKMGVRVEEGRDWLRIEGGEIHGAEIETHDDHRLAMSFGLAGLVVPGVKIKGEQCVDKSFPEFWEKFRTIGEIRR
ncbi:MAG: 3-phosphoshikimate 1-carboxyvinyltransferase [Syntrophaceae bacterium]|nr:3-phosphoshikimate 1-carboxyvinyltransferase [Syntrophaceae bacterium]